MGSNVSSCQRVQGIALQGAQLGCSASRRSGGFSFPLWSCFQISYSTGRPCTTGYCRGTSKMTKQRYPPTWGDLKPSKDKGGTGCLRPSRYIDAAKEREHIWAGQSGASNSRLESKLPSIDNCWVVDNSQCFYSPLSLEYSAHVVPRNGRVGSLPVACRTAGSSFARRRC